MKNFSDETKKVRRNAVLKVILKRYSFVVWLPLLMYISHYIGRFILLITGATIKDSCGPTMKIIVTISLGMLVLIILFLLVLLATGLIKGIIKIIKNEKTRFQNAVEEQIRKDSNKDLGGDIEN